MMPYWLLLCVSVVAGFVGAMSGMGVGVVLVPVLTASGIDIKHAIALSVLSLITVSNGATSIYLKRHLPSLRVSAFLEVFAVMGALVGALITVISGRRPLFFFCGGVILIASVTLWKQRKEQWRPVIQPDILSRQLALEGSYYDYAENRTIAYQARGASLAGPLMFGAGVVSGWLGIGSSALTVLIHDLVMGLPPKVSLSTSNLIVGVIALTGTGIYLEAGLVDPTLVIPVILGVLLGTLVGSSLLVHLTNRAVRIVFLSVLVLLGIEMLMHGIRGV